MAGERWSRIAQLAPVSKSVHTEMLTGVRTHALKFSDGERVEKGVAPHQELRAPTRYRPR